jgi:hypothetical protein
MNKTVLIVVVLIIGYFLGCKFPQLCNAIGM